MVEGAICEDAITAAMGRTIEYIETITAFPHRQRGWVEARYKACNVEFILDATFFPST